MFYKGRGNHSVRELENLVEHFKEECYQKQIKLQEAVEVIDNLEAAHELAASERDGFQMDCEVLKNKLGITKCNIG